ncbi:MAG: leucine-rich repeat protein [Clostridia bacterium]|nr:leucine-rich repeat protein [Clostridia bacterium]
MKMIIISLIIILSAFFSNAVYADDGSFGDNITWSLNDDGLLTLSGHGAMYSPDIGERTSYESVYPWLSDGRKDKIKKLVIEEGIESISQGAFCGCGNLEGIAIPESVKEIKSGAFALCSKLLSAALPENVISVPDSCFNGNLSMRSISLPGGLTSIDFYAFNQCKSLEYIVLPDGVEKIGRCAFKECERLKEIRIPEMVQMIEYEAFSSCPELEKAELSPNLKEIGEEAFSYDKNLTELYIPDGAMEIGKRAFALCYKLERLYIPESVELIGDNILVGSDNAVIYGIAGSAAEKYAVENGIKFEAVTESLYVKPDYSVKPTYNTTLTEPVKKPVISVTSINGQLDISIEGSSVEFTDAEPFIDENARTLVPVRSVFESVGCDVQYDEMLHTVKIEGKNTIIMISPGEKSIIVDYSAIPIDTEAQILNDRIFLPLRCIAEALNYEVEWQDL